MSKCCNVTNALRRDGTSQKQRFPLELAESYVQIDERSHADILNFTHKLAEQISYYQDNAIQQGNDPIPDGTWEAFFQDDLSFILAEVSLFDVEKSKTDFARWMDRARLLLDALMHVDGQTPSQNDADELKKLFQKLFEYFLLPPVDGATEPMPLPLKMSIWLDMLPESSLFADEKEYSFRDLIRDGQSRLNALWNKLQIAYLEAAESGYGLPLITEWTVIDTDLTDGTNAWSKWKDSGWDMIDERPSLVFFYFPTDGEDLHELGRVLDLLGVCQNAFVGTLENLKTSVPIYLEQSLATYPYHDPQNGLFLAFLQLFDYAKAHINSLGRKHLLYFYKDILRFAERAAVPDQAAVIMQLRKGVERHLIEPGTLLKAGKDPDGKALFFEVPEEIVLNQTAVKQLKSVYVEREPETEENREEEKREEAKKRALEPLTGGGAGTNSKTSSNSGTTTSSKTGTNEIVESAEFVRRDILSETRVSSDRVVLAEKKSVSKEFTRSKASTAFEGRLSFGALTFAQAVSSGNAAALIGPKPVLNVPIKSAIVTPVAPVKIPDFIKAVNPTQGNLSNPRVLNIYAAPVANSADGLGAELPKDEPKWNMFGEPQMHLNSKDRTMPDAEMGFAVASPLFFMHEGLREAILTFEIPKDSDHPFDNYILPDILNTVAAREYAILNGLRAQFTMEKGWGDARIESVFLVRDKEQFKYLSATDFISQLGLEGNTWDTEKSYLLSIKVVLDEDVKACVPYQESVHQLQMSTQWPVIKLSFKGRSFTAEPLGLPAFSSSLAYSEKKLMLFGGHAYIGKPSAKIYSSLKAPLDKYERLPNFELLRDLQAPYDPTKYYRLEDNAVVLYNGNIYRLINPYDKEPEAACENVRTSGADILVKNTQIGIAQSQLTNLRLSQAGLEVMTTISAETFLSPRPRINVGNVPQLADNVVDVVPKPEKRPDTSPFYWELVDLTTCIYDYLQYFKPTKLNLRVDVTGVTGVVLENDAGRLKPNKPFQPFGAAPAVGSRFYIGSKEVFGKQLTKLEISLTWQGVAAQIGNYYSEYRPVMGLPPDIVNQPVVVNNNNANERSMVLPAVPGTPQNSSWTVDVSILYDGKWEPVKVWNATTKKYDAYAPALFKTQDAKLANVIAYNAESFVPFSRDLDLSEPAKLDSNTPRGFLRLELKTPMIAFGHEVYRDLYLKEVYRVAKVLAGKTDAALNTPAGSADPTFPSEPYTPIVKEFKLNYSSKAVINFGSEMENAASYAARVDQYFHLHPFGHTEEHPFLKKGIAIVAKLPEDGYLYVGLDGLKPPSTLSMLYQLVEGSGDPDLEMFTPAWSFLSRNDWKEIIARDIIADSTTGMITSGVMRYNLKSEISLGNTLLAGNLHWLRASVKSNVPANLKVIDIVAQAVLARFIDQGNNLAHLAKSLSSGSINGLKINDPEVKQVVQPYGSNGGKLPEQADALITRVSERLRHKQRSITIWDYEHLVLEAFPGIYKVKCLNHTALPLNAGSGTDWEIAPGHVTVICIPDVRNRNAVNPFEPKTSVRTLTEVKNYLLKYTSPWVDLRIANPVFEQLSITCKVGFAVGKDPGYYTSQLEVALQQYLSPWAFDLQDDIIFGGSVHRSQIIRFIEQQDYVDFVINFSMSHTSRDGEEKGLSEAKAKTSRSIIVSAQHHNITSGDATCEDCRRLATTAATPDTKECCSNPCCKN